MADTQQVVDNVNEIIGEANAVLEIISAADPAVGQVASIANLLSPLVTKALAAYAAAADTPITPDTIAALMPNPEPLSAPEV